MFGTFRDKLKEKGTSYRGGSEEKVDEKTAAIHDAKASLAGTKNFLRVFHSWFQILWLVHNKAVNVCKSAIWPRGDT